MSARVNGMAGFLTDAGWCVHACMCMVCACVFARVCFRARVCGCMWLYVAAVDHMQCFYMCCRVGVHTGVALQSKVFDKALRLSNPARRKFPLGHITTVLSSDANNIADQEASTLLVLNACLAVCVLHVTVGWLHSWVAICPCQVLMWMAYGGIGGALTVVCGRVGVACRSTL